MTGGVAKNSGVRTCLSSRFGDEMLVPDDPQICGALGAALFAADDGR
jgi:activator of 2-hydroxyglutaryl-CoA dehydratase